MGRKRQTFSKNFKARVVLEALREESTIQEIAVKHGVHPNQVSQWKSQAIAGMESHTPPLLSNIKQLSDRLTLSAQEFSKFYT